MTFAFLILGDVSPEQDRTASIGGGSARMIGVPDLPAACAAARAMAEQGIGCIELCSAFDPDGARRAVKPPAAGGRGAMRPTSPTRARCSGQLSRATLTTSDIPLHPAGFGIPRRVFFISGERNPP